MRLRIIVTAALIAASTVAGAVAGINANNAPLPSGGKATTRTHYAYTASTTSNRYADQPNLTAPGLTEERYVNGQWTGPVTPSDLPWTLGECDPCD